MALCECGCEKEVSKGSRFVHGHNGRCRSEELKMKFADSLSKAWNNPDSKFYKIKQNKRVIRPFQKGITLCDYGCGELAIIQMKNGKFCCNKYIGMCEVVKKSNSNKHKNKISWNKGTKGLQVAWNKGLTKETNQSVALYSAKSSLSNKGRHVWNKGKKGEYHLFSEKEKERRRIEATQRWESEEYKKRVGNLISKARTDQIKSGFYNGSYNFGHYFSKKNNKEVHYRSSYELIAYKILEQLSKVKSYEVEPFAIQYEWQNSVHRTIPDILVTYTDGSKELIEVKPEWKFTIRKEVHKMAVMQKYAEDNNMIFNVWSEKQLGIN